MYWADKIADEIAKSGKYTPYHVDDMKTPSGVIHVGSLRGVMVHDLVYKALQNLGVKVTFTYVYNDMDPMDSLPNYLDAQIYKKHLGEPFFKIPAPDKISVSYARQFGDQFTASMNKIGATPQILWSSELYSSGKMNDVIREALDHSKEIRKVYKKVAGQEKPDSWYPFQVICPKCGKLGSTLVTGWDGEEVTYECKPDMVTWAKGCGHAGEISPFGGTGKLMWKVDWPAHWKAIGVTIEGAGKDHTSEGGSRDIANALVSEVFKIDSPFDIPYEWFLIGGRKMSTSKGVGTTAHTFVEILPPTISRFLFVRNHYNRQVNFDPTGDTIPKLFDLYDAAARAYWEHKDEKQARMFEYSQTIDKVPQKHFLPRFSDVVMYLQDSKINLDRKFEEIKGGSLTDEEKQELTERIKYAKIWLAEYAPMEEVFIPSDSLPQEASTLTDEQKKYLDGIADLIKESSDPEKLQMDLYNKSKELGIPAKDAFAAVYLILIGKTHGPRAAWFLLEHRELAIKRIQEILGT
ncbi:lysine--tRNA ligase [Candidatus Woesebacteria bacterium RIFCSPHIGHO2_01_FULL_41_10]|uniref:Lysine--tRNA ligase n=1 Tax=Candidatus Woesebacteria bacterium RIFCSPHIGHO2_01_FULL_41_10 TaxID=1802500 RepID=A0A1F7YR32_9BACT|nr:MAG: lysine--tRNA ligase [Candidatus Woesebacteria bacterium RIFCSPHIGHO2_01_FULL_41_10]